MANQSEPKNDTSGQVCYIAVGLDGLHKRIKEGDITDQQIVERLWSIEDYVKGIRLRLTGK